MKVFVFLVILFVISIIPVADAQFGEKASHESIEVVINSVGEVHVKHVVHSSNVPRQVFHTTLPSRKSSRPHLKAM